MSKGLLVVIGLVGLAGAAIAWFLFSPLLFDQVVEEDFPTADQVKQMSKVDRDAAMDEVMAKMAEVRDVIVSDDMPEASQITGPVVLRAGQFSGADALHKGAGSATAYQLPAGQALIRFEAFSVTNGPALVVYLAKNPAPQTADDVLAGYQSLGKLKGNKGNQNYEVPAGIDIAEYGSVVVWCELFNVLFSVAPLDAP